MASLATGTDRAGPCAAAIRSRSSAEGISGSPCALASGPTRIASRKRTSMPSLAENSTKSSSSFSLFPRIRTQLIFTRSPASRAARIPARTFARPSRRAMRRNPSSVRLSSDTFAPSKPRSRRGAARSASRNPLVVMPRRFQPTEATARAHSRKSGRMVGSPPVMRASSSPSARRAPQSSPSSAGERSSEVGVKVASSPMQ